MILKWSRVLKLQENSLKTTISNVYEKNNYKLLVQSRKDTLCSKFFIKMSSLNQRHPTFLMFLNNRLQK
jgi:hypothetical protein